MPKIAKAYIALIIASGIGLGSTYMTATKGTEIGTLKIDRKSVV